MKSKLQVLLYLPNIIGYIRNYKIIPIVPAFQKLTPKIGYSLPVRGVISAGSLEFTLKRLQVGSCIFPG